MLLFRGDDGLDELTTTTTSTVWEVRAGGVRQLSVDPELLGIARAEPADAARRRGRDNVAAAREVFAGKAGAVRDAVVLNAGAGLAAHAGLTGDLIADLRAGVARARCRAGFRRARRMCWSAGSRRGSGCRPAAEVSQRSGRLADREGVVLVALGVFAERDVGDRPQHTGHRKVVLEGY